MKIMVETPECLVDVVCYLRHGCRTRSGGSMAVGGHVGHADTITVWQASVIVQLLMI
jgi:hypothetical protein